MNQRILVLFILVIFLSLSTGSALAADKERVQERIQKQEQIYGSQLMTQQERAEYRAKMRTAKTAEEQEQIRKEHHERMKERAAERGVTLTEEPPAGGRGMGPCGEQMGPGGAGMGPRGGGMGPGGRRGR
jgi:predicted Holliday junction resolvase-like endonuclease